MKKRMFALFLVCCLWLSGLTVMCADAEEITSLPMDYEMSQFMHKYDIYSATTLEHDLTLSYVQTMGESDVSEASGAAVNELGMHAAAYVKFRPNVLQKSKIYLIYDIRLDAGVKLSEKDILKIGCPKGVTASETNRSAQLYTRGSSLEGWISSKNFSLDVSSDEKFFELSAADIGFAQKQRRVLVCIYGEYDVSTNAFESKTKTMPLELSVIWQQNIMHSEIFTFALIALTVVFDVVVIILVIRHVKKRKKTIDDGTGNIASQEAKSEDMVTGRFAAEAEHQPEISINLKPEDVEYLKEIGYFDPNKK